MEILKWPCELEPHSLWYQILLTNLILDSSCDVERFLQFCDGRLLERVGIEHDLLDQVEHRSEQVVSHHLDPRPGRKPKNRRIDNM